MRERECFAKAAPALAAMVRRAEGLHLCSGCHRRPVPLSVELCGECVQAEDEAA